MEVDETGRDDKPGRVDICLAAQRSRGDRGNGFSDNANASDGIKTGFGVHDPAVA
jgi:hypothetical protein